MSPQVKYKILREVVVILGLLEYLAFGLGALFIGAREWINSVIFFCLMGISYYISSKLSYKVLELLVKLNVS